MNTQETCKEIITALVKAQLEIEAPEKDKYHSHKKYYYSSIDAIYAAIRKPLAKNGLCLSHSVTEKEGKHFLVTTLIHISGQEISNAVPMFIQGVGSQDFGSALTYARRYAICSLLALPTEDDEDGERATDKANAYSQEEKGKEIAQEIKDGKTLSDKQKKWLREVADKSLPKLPAIFKRFNVENLDQLVERVYVNGEFMNTIEFLQGK